MFNINNVGLGVEGEHGLLVAADEESGGHVLAHHVQPGGVQGGAGVTSPGQGQRHHYHLRVLGVVSQHLSQSQVSKTFKYNFKFYKIRSFIFKPSQKRTTAMANENITKNTSLLLT